MFQHAFRIGIALGAMLAGPAMAQRGSEDPGAQRLIEQLCPPGVVCRGIRMPGADTGSTPPTLTPSLPDSGTTAQPAQPPQAAMSVPPPRQTTAPAGVAAVSITVNFATGSATLTPQAEAALVSLGRALSSAELSPYRFRIEGHTDTVGDDRVNMALSQRRAEAVRDFLGKRFGIAGNRLVAVGLGESQLLVGTPDRTPEPGNRRVQVVNLGG